MLSVISYKNTMKSTKSNIAANIQIKKLKYS